MNNKEMEKSPSKGYWEIVIAGIVVLGIIAIFLVIHSKMGALEKRLQRTEDIQAIERLQYAYNYYVEHMLKQEIIDCFADSPDVLLDWLEGKWKGKEGVKEYFDVNQVPSSNFLHQLIPSAGLITVAPDGKTARGRWYAFGGVMMPSLPQEGETQTVSRSFINGIYEIGYIKEDDIWKILTINWNIPYGVRIYDGWIMPEDIAGPMLENSTGPGDQPMSPDIPMDPDDLRYVTGYILPFHFTHPVTGKPTSEAARNERLKPLQVEKSEP
ncbi:MAG: nuclear transport factor 2 family protein [Acidobacteria bacterium]|nr:nuclear transport factor 2 family protein [Acidobacteriota bacterium]